MQIRTFPFRFAILAASIFGFSLMGCQQDTTPTPESSITTGKKIGGLAQGGSDSVQSPPTNPNDEDPEVTAFLNKKGWKLYQDTRLSDSKRLTYLSVEDKKEPFAKVTVSADDYKLLAKSKTAQVLDLRFVDNTDSGLATIAQNAGSQLEGIIVSGDDITDAGVKSLANCKTLDNINLITKKVTDVGVKELATLPKLQTLYLGFMTLDGSSFESFAKSKTLTSLSLHYVDGLTDDGVRHIAKLPNLNELKIKSGFGKSKVTTAGIKAIVDTRLPAKFDFDSELIDDDLFVSLVDKGWLYGPTPPGEKSRKPATAEGVPNLSIGESISDKGFAAILNCTNIRSLYAAKSRITDESLKKLAGFKKLELLTLDQTKITGEGLDAIVGLPIKELNLGKCEMTEDMLKAIGKMSHLEDLFLRGSKLKPEWLQHLSTLPKLKKIDLMDTDFDDKAAKYLVSMPSLKEAILQNTKLGDTGFQELLNHPILKTIDVDRTNVTKEVYQKAKKDYPKRSFYFNRYDR